jgi:phosphatidylglycerophosphate synthase
MTERIDRQSTGKKLTVPNVITALGGVFVMKGLFGKDAGLDTAKGVVEVGGGMILDAADGLTARELPILVEKFFPNANTERLGSSTFGNKFEHTLDKAKAFALAVELWRKDMLPKWMIGVFATLEVAKAAPTAMLYVKHRHDEEEFDTKPTNGGRYGNALMLGGMGGEFIAGKLGENGRHNKLTKGLRFLSYAAFAAGTVLTGSATKTYIERLAESDL